METLTSFMDAHAHRLWHDKHLRDCQFMVQRLANYQDNADKPLADFTVRDILAFQDHLVLMGLCDNTVNRYLACFSCLFNLAVEHEIIDRKPRMKFLKVRSSRPRFFTDKEIDDLVNFLDNSSQPWMSHFVTLGVNTGMRLGEILGINNPDSKTQGYVSQCGTYVTLTDTKNGDQRIVPLNQAARGALKALDMYPAGPYTHRKFYDTWAEARDELARDDKHYVFHVLRHTCATRLAMEHNVDSITLGKILGHRSIATTQKYVHTKPDALSAIMSKLENRGAA